MDMEGDGFGHLYHPGQIYYKIVPWHIFFCNNSCHYYRNNSPEDFICNVAAMLPLACPFLQEKRDRILLCKLILLYFFTKINCSKTFSL